MEHNKLREKLKERSEVLNRRVGNVVFGALEQADDALDVFGDEEPDNITGGQNDR